MTVLPVPDEDMLNQAATREALNIFFFDTGMLIKIYCSMDLREIKMPVNNSLKGFSDGDLIFIPFISLPGRSASFNQCQLVITR